MDAENTADPVQTFAERLRRLQRDAGGPLVRDLVRLTAQVGAPYTRGTLHDKLAGRSVATWEFVEAFVAHVPRTPARPVPRICGSGVIGTCR